MKKYFIADKYFNNKTNGLYCIYGYGNTKDQFFVTSLILYNNCSHANCSGDLLEINENYSFFTIKKSTNLNFAAGDIKITPISRKTQSIILFYNDTEILSVIRAFSHSALLLEEFGEDFAFLLACLSHRSAIGLKYNNSDNLESIKKIANEKEDSSIPLKICNYSYIFRWLKCRLIDIKKRDFQAIFSSFLFEFFIAFFLLKIATHFLSSNNNLNLRILINDFVQVLRDLLTWLMGVPVGLKLNRQFSKVLGQFYMFHISIWENYMMSSVLPFVPYALSALHFLTPLGISFFLCFLLDISSLVTLHLTCFYIYACKLYRLQVIILCSLYRLFHGQKWNPFRERVDTGPSEIDRLFTSTLILALSVFLLPTTALYYLVFASIELFLLANEYLLSGLVQLLHRLQVLHFLTWLCNHPRHRNVAHLEKVAVSDTCLLLQMKFNRAPLSSIFKSDVEVQIQPRLRLHKIISCLFKGHIVKRL